MKRRSARLEEPFVFFVDRCLGRHDVPGSLREAILDDERVEIHDDHFAQNAKDAEWLAEVGERGWVVLSQDRNITRNPLEQAAIVAANVAFFGVGRADAPAASIANALAAALPRVRSSLRRFLVPLIATVHVSGDVTVKWAAGKRLGRVVRMQGLRGSR